MIKILVIGAGPHAKRIYFPLINHYASKYQMELVGIVDLKSQKDIVETYLSDHGYNGLESLYLDVNYFKQEDGQKVLNTSQKELLSMIVEKLHVNAVIIATEPLSHKTYALWAIENDLHILMDKPVTTRYGIVNAKEHPMGLIDDYQEIKQAYIKQAQLSNIIFSCMSQRRYHGAYNQLLSSIQDVGEKTHIPVTSIFIQHCDGQWRFPDEIISEIYHGYNEGYGKCSHSGYHFFDMLGKIIETSIQSTGKEIDSIDVYSDFVYPKDFIEQITVSDYSDLFGKSSSKDQEFYRKEFEEKTYGEIDANISFTLKKSGKKIATVRLSLLHNGFSERSRFDPNSDLYKGNGRVRHETVLINQGPVQTVQYQSYQLKQVLKQDNGELAKIGGELHSKLYVYENIALTEGKENLREYDYSNIDDSKLQGYSRGHQEKSRELCFVEFLEAVIGNIPIESVQSSILNHDLTVLLMAYSYESALQKKKVTFSL